MTTENRANTPAGDASVPVASVDDPYGLASWMRWWLPAATQPPTLPGLSISPQRLAELQDRYVKAMTAIWNDFVTHPDRTAAPIRDPRFSDPAWQENSLASFAARTYLINAEFMNELAANVEADPKTKARVRFAVSQWVDATAPSNFLAFNPKVQKRLIETKGGSLTHGLQNLLEDVVKGKISQTDETAFEIGRNVATSEGSVVFENDLIQLIQYKPLTARVRARPFVIVPPCINKFYILDLQPDNSLVRFCVERGNTVFMVSWRNPGRDQSGLTWDDYVERGPIAALNVAREISGAGQLNALGFCVGGTLVAAALAVMRARGDDPVASLTLLTSLLDFSDAGILDIFIDETHVRMREQTIGKGGLMPGRERPGLELCGEQLPGRPPAARVRSALLERRQHQSAGSDVLMVPAQPVPREQPDRPEQALHLRCCGRPRSDPGAHLRVRGTRGPHRSVERRVRFGPRADRGGSGRAAICAGGQRPHRRHDQRGVEEPAQLLDQ